MRLKPLFKIKYADLPRIDFENKNKESGMIPFFQKNIPMDEWDNDRSRPMGLTRYRHWSVSICVQKKFEVFK